MIATVRNTSLLIGLGLTLIALSGCATTGSGKACCGPDKSACKGCACDFEGFPIGKAPECLSIRQTNPTTAMATWKVIADESAPSGTQVMALTASKNYNGTYNLAVCDCCKMKNIDLTVKVKAVSGVEDQGGGPIWRCIDENNYYICRFNPLEGNYRVYFVKDGKRKQLGHAKIDLTAGKWYTLRVTAVDKLITCYLDGVKLLEVTDETFAEPGMIGLWTKADAVTSFDDLAITPLD